MKRNTKRIIIITLLLAALALAIASVNYLNKVYLPIKIKTLLVSSLRDALHQDVDIGRINFSFINGIVIEDISIYDKIKDDENSLLYIKKASFHFLYLPLFKEQRVIIPVLHIYSPQINLRFKKDGAFNIPAWSPVEGRKRIKQKEFPLPLIYKINILRGSLSFRDERQSPAFNKSVNELNIGLSAGNLKKLSFTMHGAFPSPEEKPSKISVQGSYLLAGEELNAKLTLTNLSLTELNPYLKGIPLDISSGVIESTSLSLKLKDKKISLAGESSIKGLNFKKEGLSIEADTGLLSQVSFSTDTEAITYKLNFRLDSARVSGIPYINEASSIKGELEWSNKGVRTNKLEFRSLDSDFKLAGSLEDASGAFLKAVLRSEQLNLEKAFLLLNPRENISLSGRSKVKITLKGKLDELLKNMKAEFLIEDAKFKTAFLKDPLEHIKGGLNLGGDTADWQGLSFNYRGTAYTSSGRLVGFKNPQLNFKVNSEYLDLSTDIKINDSLISLRAIKAKYLGSDCDIKGSIDTQEERSPVLELGFSLNIDPQDIPGLLPKETGENIKKFKPKGMIHFSGSLSGKADDSRGWDIQAQGSSELFSLYNLKFNNLSFSLAQKDRILNISGLTASLYSGKLNLDFICNLQPQQPSYSLKFSSLGVLLELLSPDIGIEDRDISGIIDINANLVGSFSGSSSLRGNGNISVQQGRLWQLNLLKGLGELFLISDYKNIIFKGARADFYIADNAFSTDNLELIAEQLRLDCEGSLWFDGRLDFTAYAQVNKELIRESPDLRKFTAAILGQVGNAMTIKVRGTIQKPEYRMIPMPLDVIKRLKDFFLGK